VERKEAVALIRELIRLNLAHPSFIDIEKNERGTYSIVLKANGDVNQIRAFLAKTDLLLLEDMEKGTCTIYKP
jgi:hypothetical protein